MGKEHRMTIRKRGDVYHYQFQINNTTYCGTLPTAKTDPEALKLEADEKAKVRLGLREVDVDDNFSRFINDVYLKYSRENKESFAHDEFRCQMLIDYFHGKGMTRFRDITMLAVVSFINHRLATKVKRHRQVAEATRLRSPVTVYKEFGTLTEVFNMAIETSITKSNPCNSIPRKVRQSIRARSKRPCSMSPEKEALLLSKGLAGAYAHLKPICLFDLHTGLRLGEVSRLERDHFNLNAESKWFDLRGQMYEVPHDCFIVMKSKNGQPRVLPMNGIARSVAVHQLDDSTVGQFIFPGRKKGEHIKEVKKGLAGACKQSGIKYGQYEPDGITFHTFRHWFNSKLEELGVSKTVRRDLLGHQPKDITDDYTHSTIEMRRRAVSLLCQTSSENVLNFEAKSGKSLAAG
jgi:integrase